MKSFKIALIALFFVTTMQLSYAGKLESSVRNFWAAVDGGDFDKAALFLSSGIQVSLPLSPVPLDLEAYKGLGMAFRAGFPDIRHKILECTEGKMNAAVRGVFSGTNTGSLMGNPPTGNRVELPFLQYWTFDADGKAIRLEMAFDVAAFNAQLMKGLSNKDFANTMMAELNKHNLDGVLKNCAADAKFHGWEPQTLDAKGYRNAMAEILAAFPDAKFVISDVIADGDKVVVRHQLEGTHTGAAFKGVPVTNRKIMVPATVIFQVRNGKATELWLNADALGLMIQLGAFPVSK